MFGRYHRSAFVSKKDVIFTLIGKTAIHIPTNYQLLRVNIRINTSKLLMNHVDLATAQVCLIL